MSSLSPTIWGEHRLEWGQRTYVMGIINGTPDSFAGDGLLENAPEQEAFVQRAVAQAQQLARVLPVVGALYAALPKEVMISIDSYKAEVARQALDAGACIVNDIWGLRHDATMATLVAERGVPVVLMANMRGYRRREIVSDVVRFLAGSIDLALAAGVAWERIIIDPGIGFGTTPAENLALLHRVREMVRVVKMSDAVVRGAFRTL